MEECIEKNIVCEIELEAAILSLALVSCLTSRHVLSTQPMLIPKEVTEEVCPDDTRRYTSDTTRILQEVPKEEASSSTCGILCHNHRRTTTGPVKG